MDRPGRFSSENQFLRALNPTGTRPVPKVSERAAAALPTPIILVSGANLENEQVISRAFWSVKAMGGSFEVMPHAFELLRAERKQLWMNGFFLNGQREAGAQ